MCTQEWEIDFPSNFLKSQTNNASNLETGLKIPVEQSYKSNNAPAPKYNIQNSISVLNHTLWEMGLVHCGIYEFGLLHSLNSNLLEDKWTKDVLYV